MKYVSGKGKTSLQQKLDIEKKFPVFECSVNRNSLRCIGNIRSSFSNKEYKVKIIKDEKKSPKVFILKPEIIKKHVYSDSSLCFYFYKNFIWSKDYWISEYIIPWTAAWIYFYEVWIINGIWYGEEVEHVYGKKIEPD